VLRNDYTQEFDDAGAKAEPFPGQFLKSLNDGANHLGGDETTPGVDPEREFMPAGQGGGAITELVPAGELVARFMTEAEAALDAANRLR
jgi:enoyl-[acyl-carrier protein] reductase II